MWREEPGCFEMLLAFYKENELDANKSYRDFLFDLLECYEEKNCAKDTDCDRSSMRKRRRLSHEKEMRKDMEEVPEPPKRKPGPASKTGGQRALLDEDIAMEIAPPPNGTNLASASSSSETPSRREKVTQVSRSLDPSKQYVRVPDPSKKYVRVPDPKPLPTLGQSRPPMKVLPAASKLAPKNRLGQRTIAPNPAAILGNLSQLGGMFGAGEDFGNGFPCILCSRSFDSEETYQRHDCFAASAAAPAPLPGPSFAPAVSAASGSGFGFKCRCCALSFPNDHRRLRHERNAHGLNV